MNSSMTCCNFNLPANQIISVEEMRDGTIFISKKAKDSSNSHQKNGTLTTLNIIKLGVDNGSKFTCRTYFGTENISDVARAIYETAYNKSWQSTIDGLTNCFSKEESDHGKIKGLLYEILKFSEVKILPQQPGYRHNENKHSPSKKREKKSSIDSPVKVFLQIEVTDLIIRTFLFEHVFAKLHTCSDNLRLIEIVDNLKTSQIQQLVELNKKNDFLQDMLLTLKRAAKASDSPSINKLIAAFYQAYPDSPSWEKFLNDPYLAVPICSQKTISLLSRSLENLVLEKDHEMLIHEIRLSFKPLEELKSLSIWTDPFSQIQNYMYHVLSYIVALSKTEGLSAAQMKLKLFVNANMQAMCDFEIERPGGFWPYLIMTTISHNEDLIPECYSVLHSTDFELTSFIVEEVVSEFHKNQGLWNYVCMRHFENKEEALFFIETFIKIAEQIKYISSSRSYDIFCEILIAFLRNLDPYDFFEEIDIASQKYPSLPERLQFNALRESFLELRKHEEYDSLYQSNPEEFQNKLTSAIFSDVNIDDL